MVPRNETPLLGDVLIRHYVLDGAGNPLPVDFLTWACWMGDDDNCRIRLDQVGDSRISTVFLGLDHRFGGEGPPILFETMIFDSENEGCFQERYTTRAQAIARHEQIVAMVRDGRLKELKDS